MSLTFGLLSGGRVRDVSTFVYYVQNGNSSALAGLLNGIFSSAASEATKASASGNKSKTTAATKANVSGAKTPVPASKNPVVQTTSGINNDF